MLAVLGITAPFFLVIACGYGAVRLGAIKPVGAQALGEFVLRFALPALIFKSLAERPLRESVQAGAFFAYLAASLAAFAIAYLVARRLASAGAAESAVQALGSSMSNSGMIGAPVAFEFVGPGAGAALAIAFIVENAVIIPLMLTLAEGGSGKGRATFGRVAAALAANPIVGAIVLGLLASALGAPLPQVVSRLLGLMAQAAAPVALFAVGGRLVGANLAGVAGPALRVAAAKLALHPLLTVGALAIAATVAPPLAADTRKALTIFASAPMVGIFPLLAAPYRQERAAAAALLTAAAASFVTMSGVIAALG